MIEQVDWVQIEVCLTQKTSDWKKREEDLQLLIDRLDRNDGHAMEFVIRNSKIMALQLNDLRSALVKLASMAIEKAASNAAESKMGVLEKFTDSFLKDANLVKALGSANKVINIHAGTAFRALFETSQVTLATLEAFYNANKDNKNISLRERIAEAFCVYISSIGKAKDKRIKTEGVSFLKKALEGLCKDASGNVRTSAKKAKAILDKVEDAITVGGFVTCSMEEESFEAKTMSRSRELHKSKNNLNLSYEKSKTMPIPRREHSKGMEIENDDTLPSKFNDISAAKKDIKKLKTKTESIIDILENPKKQIKEKVDQIAKQNLEEFYNTCDSDDYKKLLGQFQTAKNFEIKKLIVKLIEGVKISKFMGTMLSYTEKERLDKKLNYSFFIARLMQEELIEFIEFFLVRNNSFALKLLQKRFDVEEFENIIADNNDLVQSLLTIVSQNITDGTSENYIKLNVCILESIYQSSQVVTQHKHFTFTDAFFYRLNDLNPDLHKFLQNHKRKLGEKVVFKPNNNNEQQVNVINRPPVSFHRENKVPYTKNDEKMINPIPAPIKPAPIQNMEEPHELHESADSRLELLMTKANSQTKKTVIKSILAHLKQLQGTNEKFSADKIFNKTLEILKCTFESDDLDDEIVNLGCKLAEEIHRMFEKDKSKCMSIYDIVFDVIRLHPAFKDKVLEFVIASSLRNQFYAHIIMCVDSKDISTVIDGIRILINMLKVGKESLYYPMFHKEVAGLISDTTKIMRELFVHPEVGVRKNVVHFIVQCYFFADNNVFLKMLNEFSPEQQKLVEIYIKKSES